MRSLFFNSFLALFAAAVIFGCSSNTAEDNETANEINVSEQVMTKVDEVRQMGREDFEYVITAVQDDIELGQIEIQLYPKLAPRHVWNFDSLVSIGFYDGTAFHRVIPGFMIQGGDPQTKSGPREKWGMGMPGQKEIQAEFSKDSTHRRGIISAARKGGDVNSATSQFFITVADVPHLDGQYTIYGQALSGMDVVDKIAALPRDSRDGPINKVEIMIKKK